MNLKKFAQVAGLVSRRDSRMKVVQKVRKKLQIDFMGNELEKRQLLATFSYSSNLLTIQTDSANEQLSIISTSEAGNYTITTSGTWSGSPVTGLSNTSTNLYVNQPSGLASILINDNSGTVSNSSLSFGTSSANFVDDLTVSFTNATAGSITIGNTARFIGSSSVSLTGQKVTVSAGISTVDGNLSLTGTGATGVNSINGVSITGATVTTANGLLTINGTSFGTGYGGVGVSVSSSSVVSATGSGNITIIGTAATGTDYVYGYGQDSSSVSRVNTGTLTINGTACGTGSNARGLELYGSTVEATGTGNIIINANVPTGTGDGYGVYLAYTNLKTANGGITIDSFSQAATGIYAPHSFVFANGTGAININSRSGGFPGIQLDDATFTTNNGPIALNAVSLAGGMDAQIYSGSKFLANNSGTVGLTANNIYFQTTDNNFTTSSLTILTRGRGFNLGAAGNSTLLGLTQAALNQFHTPNLTLGNGSTGNISLASSVTWSSNISLYSGVPIVGTVSNSSHTFTQGSNTLTATEAISATYINLLEVTTNADSGAGSLRSVVAYAASHAGDDVITFSSSLSTPITLTTPITINDGTGNLTITGLGSGSLTISGGSSTGLFNVQSNATLTDLTFSDATGAGLTGGGAFYSTSNLGLTNVVINTSTAAQGAAVYQTGGSLVVTTSSIVNSVFVTGGANYTVIGGSLGTDVSISSGNQVSITGLNQDITLGSVNAGSLTVTTDSTANAINVTGPVAVTGSGAISLTGRNISVTGNITTQAGDITLYGNGGGSYRAGSFDGVCISGSTVNVNTTSGNITIDGRGASGSVNKGVKLASSKVQAGGSGCLTITGLSGNGSTNGAYGVYATGATVTTSSGSLTFNGTSCGTGADSIGVNLEASSNISATGTGQLTITGAAANGTDRAIGVRADGSSVRTSTGSITVNGASCGTGSSSKGVVLVSSANISATALGNVTIIGTAANGTTYATGVEIDHNSSVTANSGSMTVNGTSCGTTTNSKGVSLSDFSEISASGTGPVNITGTACGTDNAWGVSVTRSTVTVSTGSLTINGTSCGTRTFSTGVNLDSSANISATSSGNVAITGTAANGTDYTTGVSAVDSSVTTSSGSIVFNGTSCGTGSSSRGVYLKSSNITSTSTGNVTITGTAANGTYFATGVNINSSNVTTSSGSITVNGTSCGTRSSSKGIYLRANASISATSGGDVAITGNAACGTNYARGVLLNSSNIVTTNSGSITITGTSSGAGTNSAGIYLLGPTNISANGAGNVTITGSTSGNSTGIGFDSIDLSAVVYSNAGFITLTANSLNLGGPVNATTAGNVTIQPIGNGTLINLGDGTDTITTLGLSAGEIGQITASTLTIGSVTAGNITVSTPVTWPTNMTLLTSGTITGRSNLTVGGTLLPAPTFILVTNANDSGAGSLRDAISTASTSSGDDEIHFDTTISGNTIALLTPLTINDSTGNLTIVGLGASNLTISGNGSSGIFKVLTRASISSLTLTAGYGTGLANGGAIYSNTTLGLSNLVINNSSASLGSAIYETGGSLTLTSSNIANSIYFAGSGNLSVIGGSLGSTVTVASGNTVSISNYTSSANGFSFNSNSIILSNITASGNFIVAGNTTTSCISVTGPIAATGANSISLTGRNIAVTSNITSQAGDITLYGNGGGSYQTGSFDGVCISGAGVNVNTTSGNITIDGRGASGSVNKGVNLLSSMVQAGGSGFVTVTGVSGDGTNNAYGIYASGATVTTNTGSLTVNGTSCGTGNSSKGLYLEICNITSTSSGDVTITGKANGTGWAYGLHLYQNRVTTSSGSITVTGTSYGTGTYSSGVYLRESDITSASGAGNVTITGIAANGTDSACGIYFGTSNVTTSTGSITVNGTSCGTGNYSSGVSLRLNGNVPANISASGTGNVTITGTAVNGANGTTGVLLNKFNLIASTGSLTVNGTACGTGTGSKGVYLFNFANIAASGSSNVTINGKAANGTNNAIGIYVENSCVTSSSGSLKVNGTSCGTGTYSQGVYLNSSANIAATGAGNVTITGTAANGAGDAYGISVLASSVSSHNGTLDFVGISRSVDTHPRGVSVRYSTVTATGAGSMSISGSAMNGTDQACGILTEGATILANNGTLMLNGTACSTGYWSIYGLSLANSNISATGAGDVNITGSALGGGVDFFGIYASGTRLASNTGTITISTTSCGTGGNVAGFYVESGSSILASGIGSVSISGITPLVDNSGIGFNYVDSGSSINSNGGLITLAAKTLDLVGTVNATSAGNVLIQTLGAGVNLGGADSSANLGLTSYEIGQITANMLTIGNSTSGNIAISDAISFGNLTLRTGGSINETGTGQLSVNGTANFVATGNITLNNATNDFGTVKASGAAISIDDSNDLVFGATGTDITAITGGALTVSTNPITSSGNVNLTAVGLIRNTSGGINATSGTGTIRLTSSANSIIQTAAPIQGKGDITLNAFGNLTVDGAGVDTSTGTGNITLVSSSSFVIINGSGLNSSGKVNANAVELITVQGNAIRANGVIQLTSSANSIISTSAPISGRSNIGLNAAGNITITGGGMTTASGSGNISLTSTGSFITIGGGGLTSSGNINATASGLITVTAGGINATTGSGGVTLSSTANGASLGTIRSKGLAVNTVGAIVQTGAANVSTGTASFSSTGAISLTQSNNFGTVTANGANITISDADSVNIGNIQSTGNLTITTGGTTNLGANITTAGDQLYNSPVMLTNNITLRTTANGNATFVSTLNGAYALTANLGTGSLINQGAVGSSTSINLASVGNITGSDLNLTITPGAMIGSIVGSGSNNTITVQSLANQTTNIVISGTNSGNITSSGGTSVGSFTGITRLVGGAGSDTFKFVNNSALLNGTIDGGSGTNGLNYSGTTKPTFINLGTGQATGVTSTASTGVVTNIQNVFGGTGNDYLTGSAASNVMDGGAGDDTMSGLGGNDIMVGNYGADSLNGGAGIDILIGGYVDFVVGSLQEGLESIMSTWNNVTDGTFNAVSNTIGTASSTQPRLVGDTNLASTYLLQTVFNDQATDRLTDIASSTTPNWFFATERVTQGNDVVLAGTTFTVSKKTVTSKTGRTAR